jgi:hypothetical protein
VQLASEVSGDSTLRDLEECVFLHFDSLVLRYYVSLGT